jgi:hypothetical protein
MRADERGGAKFLLALNGQVGGYSPDGSLSPLLGRKGKGPGEFESPGAIGFVGDTTWVFDMSLDRLTFLDGQNAVVRTLSPSGFPQSWNSSTGVDPASIHARGTAFLIEFHRGQPASSNWNALLKVPSSRLGTASIPRDAQRIDSVGGEKSLVIHAGSASRPLSVSLPYPFSDADIMAFAPNGSLVAIVRRKMNNTSSPSFTLTVHGTTGLLRTDTIRSTHAAVRITESLIDAAWLKEGLRLTQGGIQEGAWSSEAAARNAYMDALKAPSHLPPVAKALVGNDSTIWLEKASSGALAEWEVYDAHGRVLGRFNLPRSFTGVTASGNFIWGYEPDEEGQDRMARYRVARR